MQPYIKSYGWHEGKPAQRSTISVAELTWRLVNIAAAYGRADVNKTGAECFLLLPGISPYSAAFPFVSDISRHWKCSLWSLCTLVRSRWDVKVKSGGAGQRGLMWRLLRRDGVKAIGFSTVPSETRHWLLGKEVIAPFPFIFFNCLGFRGMILRNKFTCFLLWTHSGHRLNADCRICLRPKVVSLWGLRR